MVNRSTRTDGDPQPTLARGTTITLSRWLEQLIHEFNSQGIINSVTQGQLMRRLLHGKIRSELDS
jgi:hypothetical protein